MAIRMKTEVKLRARADCPSHSRADVSIRDLVFAIDEPTERGGTNAGPAPTDTALAALIGCTNVIGHKCAQKLGIDIGQLDISADCDFDRRGVTLDQEIDVPFRRIDLQVRSHGTAGDNALQLVAAEVRKYCPLSKLFTAAGTEIHDVWQSAD